MKEGQGDVFVISGSLAQQVLKGNDQVLITKEIDRKIIQKIASELCIGFVSEKEREGEVCFMNSEEVRPEFKVSFAPIDIENYLLAVIKSPDLEERLETLSQSDRLIIPYPKDAVDFWTMVERGKQWRADQRNKQES